MSNPHELVSKMDRPSKVCVVSEAEKNPPAWVVDEMKRVWKSNPLQTPSYGGVFRMTDYIGIGVSRLSPHRLINSGGGSTPKTHVNKEVKGAGPVDENRASGTELRMRNYAFVWQSHLPCGVFVRLATASLAWLLSGHTWGVMR
jgi:hypothetical protein